MPLRCKADDTVELGGPSQEPGRPVRTSELFRREALLAKRRIDVVRYPSVRAGFILLGAGYLLVAIAVGLALFEYLAPAHARF